MYHAIRCIALLSRLESLTLVGVDFESLTYHEQRSVRGLEKFKRRLLPFRNPKEQSKEPESTTLELALSQVKHLSLQGALAGSSLDLKSLVRAAPHLEVLDVRPDIWIKLPPCLPSYLRHATEHTPSIKAISIHSADPGPDDEHSLIHVLSLSTTFDFRLLRDLSFTLDSRYSSQAFLNLLEQSGPSLERLSLIVRVNNNLSQSTFFSDS
jgi:hypothetical protein